MPLETITNVFEPKDGGIMDTLLISPEYTSGDWHALDRYNPDHWRKAADIVRDRLEGKPATA